MNDRNTEDPRAAAGPSRRRFLWSAGRIGLGASAAGLFAGAGIPLAGAEPPAGAAAAGIVKPEPLKVLFYGGGLPAVRQELSKLYLLQPLEAGQKRGMGGSDPDNIQGLEHLDVADVWVGSAQKRNHPSDAQLAHFRKFLDAGKPFVGYRAASHIFQNWLEQDKAVWGAKYGGHHLLGKDKELVVRPADRALEHSILKGIEPPTPTSGSYNYTELEPDVTVLLYSGLEGAKTKNGKDDFQPHTWVRENKRTGGRAFYTRYDSKQIDRDPVAREIFVRGLVWALNRDMARHRKGEA